MEYEVPRAVILGLMRASMCVPIVDGGFMMVLPPGEYRVNASVPNYLSAPFKGRDGRSAVVLAASQQREDVDIYVAAPAVAVVGMVRDISGGVVDRAVVFGSEGNAFAMTDEEGAFTLWVSASASVEVTAFAPGYNSASRRARAPVDGVFLQLVPESALVGRVLRADTQAPVVGLDVSIQTSAWPDATTDEEGRFEVHGLSPGTPYRPMVRSRGWCGETESSMFVDMGETLRSADIMVHSCQGQEVRVLTLPERRPCSGAAIEILDQSNVIVRTGYTDGDGQANFYDLAAGAYLANIACPEYVPRRGVAWLVEARAGGRTDWEVAEGGRIIGRVMGPKDGIASAGVTLRAQDVVLDAVTDLSGAFVIAGAPAGSGTITARHWTHPGEVEESIVIPDRGAAVQVVLRLTPGAVVRGTVKNSGGPIPPGLTVGAYSRDSLARSATKVSTSGAFSFHNLYSQRFAIFPQASGGLRGFDEIEPLAPPVNVDLSDGQPREVHFVVNIKMADLTVSVADATGAPVDDAVVSLDEEMDRYEGQQSLTDETGAARFKVRSDRTYKVQVVSHFGQVVEATRVSAPGKLTLKLEPLRRVCGVLSVAGATTVGGDVAIGTDASPAELFTLTPDLRWCLGQVRAGERTFTARTAQFGTASLKVQVSESGETPAVTLVLSGYASVRWTLVDAQGVPLADQEVWIVDATGRRIGEHQATDPQGQLVAERVPVGEVRLIARPAGFNYSRDEVARRTVTVSVGPDENLSTVRFDAINAPGEAH